MLNSALPLGVHWKHKFSILWLWLLISRFSIWFFFSPFIHQSNMYAMQLSRTKIKNKCISFDFWLFQFAYDQMVMDELSKSKYNKWIMKMKYELCAYKYNRFLRMLIWTQNTRGCSIQLFVFLFFSSSFAKDIRSFAWRNIDLIWWNESSHKIYSVLFCLLWIKHMLQKYCIDAATSKANIFCYEAITIKEQFKASLTTRHSAHNKCMKLFAFLSLSPALSTSNSQFFLYAHFL